MQANTDRKTLNLHENMFFLHSFLDENIGSNIGNHFADAIDGFKEHSPPVLNAKLDGAFNLSLNILSLYGDIWDSNYIVEANDLNGHDFTYRYTLHSEESKIDISDHVIYTKNGKSYLCSSFKNNASPGNNLIVLPKGYATKYYTSHNFFIDNETEMDLDYAIDIIINNAIQQSETSHVYLPIGYTLHAMGLLLTKTHVVITNGGEGTSHHNFYESKNSEEKTSSDNMPYPQCVLFFNRPCQDILKKLLKEFIQISSDVYENTNIEYVYNIIYKLYFLHVIETNHYGEDVDDIMRSLTHTIIANNIDYNPNNSIVLKAAMIHPNYYEEVLYTPFLNKKIKEELLKIFTEELLTKYFEQRSETGVKYIAGTIAYYLNILITKSLNKLIHDSPNDTHESPPNQNH